VHHIFLPSRWKSPPRLGWYDHPLPSYSVIAADTLHDLGLWHFDLGQWSYMAGHVINPSTKFEDPMAIRSWVMSSDISRRIPLTMRLQPLHMRRITWPMRRGQIFPHIWNPWPRFAYSLYNLYGATMTFKGPLLLAPLMLKAVFRPIIFKYRLNQAPNVGFRGKRGVDVKFGFCDL